ncbi:hypothetical protein [Stenomitos frigidus]|uniref:Uncharacterized protein n=1 Tax=Stenomitos frigidus ULC18 TaxID=2107698 RepID=A0A2T1DYT6_9CYAN|nr:hypothetical protein [Stenomitos frigidus]PSB25534.1 hypothetical protein C7B82_23220 [Stenomitos frigidus ULC18]
MQFSFSDASAVRVVEPTVPTRSGKVTVAAHKQSLHAIASKVSLEHRAQNQADQNQADQNQADQNQADQNQADQNQADQNQADQNQADQNQADQTSLSELPPAEPLTVVKQTIDDLEAQGLLMLFDRHDQVAKRLTDDLISAGVLPENLAIDQLVETHLQDLEPAFDSEQGEWA